METRNKLADRASVFSARVGRAHREIAAQTAEETRTSSPSASALEHTLSPAQTVIATTRSRRSLHPGIVLASEWSLPSICPPPIGSGGGRRACARWLAPPASRLPPPCRAGLTPHRALYPGTRTIAPTARAGRHLALNDQYAGRRRRSLELTWVRKEPQ